MGQYWIPVNLDKCEFVDPNILGSGMKLREQIGNPGVGAALIILLANMPYPRGGGDLDENEVIGRWAGDRVVIVGDYAQNGDLAGVDTPDIYDRCMNGEYTNVSTKVRAVLDEL